MFIAFEGPDNTGKSTQAAALDCAGQPDYNVTKAMHAQNVAEFQGDPSMPHTYDRIDWFSHMVYRLALPDHEWNDERPRTVFAMPDTHLVVKIHRADLAHLIKDELYDVGTLAKVNPMYWYFADYFMSLNRVREYALFKSITVVEVTHDQETGEFAQRIAEHDSPAFESGYPTAATRIPMDDGSLLDFLRYVDQNIG